MNIKNIGFDKTLLNPFDLLGAKETSLTKAFAFLLGVDASAMFKFLRFLGVNCKNTPSNYKLMQIDVEVCGDGGRTDIELILNRKFYVVVEAKVGNNNILAQNSQYLDRLKAVDYKHRIMCFISNERNTNKQQCDGIAFISISWFDIINLYDRDSNPICKQFCDYLIKNYKMKNQREVLIQDLGVNGEIKRFKEYNVYRRDRTNGTPLYFAPYFTRKAGQSEGEGVAYISRVLGVLTLSKANDINAFEDDLKRFADNDNVLVEKWIAGVKTHHPCDEVLTYYFLGNPLRLNRNLMKDRGVERGRGKDWIASFIPKNRCVPFEVFLDRLMNY